MIHPFKVHFLCSLLLFLVFGQNLFSQSPQPNIIFILADDLGYGDVSFFNTNGKIQTPHIDALAKKGVAFTDAHSGSAVCTPTRYGILTGQYSWRTRLKKGVLTEYDKPLIQPERTTMASMLKQQGYQTACIGKWHLGWDWSTTDGAAPVDSKDKFNLDFSKPIAGGPLDRGFDYFFGMDAPNYPPYCYIENRTTVGIPSFFYSNHPYGDCRAGYGIESWDLKKILPDLQQKAVSYIADASKTNQPFFLYLPLTAPHTPIAPDDPFLQTSGLNVYADFVLQVDHVVGAIQKALEDNKISDNTLLVFTSDNGCSPVADFKFLQSKGHQPSGPFRGTKADLYEGGHRVPLVVQWPAKIKRPHVVSQTVALNDFMSTFAAVTAYALSDNEAEDSYNLLPALLKPNYPKTVRESTVHHSIDGSFAIRKGDWKLMLTPGSGGWSFPRPGKEEAGLPAVQLYNLKQDPGEVNNLQDKYPTRVEELTSLLNTIITQKRSTP